MLQSDQAVIPTSPSTLACSSSQPKSSSPLLRCSVIASSSHDDVTVAQDQPPSKAAGSRPSIWRVALFAGLATVALSALIVVSVLFATNYLFIKKGGREASPRADLPEMPSTGPPLYKEPKQEGQGRASQTENIDPCLAVSTVALMTQNLQNWVKQWMLIRSLHYALRPIPHPPGATWRKLLGFADAGFPCHNIHRSR